MAELSVRRPVPLLMPGLLAGAVVVGAASTYSATLALAGLVAAAVVAVVWVRPAVGAYLVIGLTPLTVGIDRGLAIPVFRPNEALCLVVGATLVTRGLVRARSGGLPRLRITRLELSLVAMAVASSVVPLLWMVARHRPIDTDDLLYALVMWKYLGVYAIVRFAVRDDAQVKRCLWVSVTVASVVATIAIVQSLGLFGVPGLLAHYYAPFGDTGATAQARGSSTLALPAATADLLIYNLAIVVGLWLRMHRFRGLLAVAAVLMVFGALSAGEFSSAIGLVVALVSVAAVTGAPRLLALFVPAAAGAAVVLRPVFSKRLEGFDSASGLPESWVGRLNNLRTYFWPTLFRDDNWTLGVRPAARVPVSSQILGYVWIESGYTWLLWGGGIPLLASFVWFVVEALRTGWRGARRTAGAAGVAGIAVFVAVIVTAVLMVFDPHLTYRGSADELFALLALTVSARNRKAVS
ncbi:MAG TPA: hypothetical protein VGN37_15100 [Actinocatenispora sp.]